MQRGHILGKQDVLMMLLSGQFEVNEEHKQLIRHVEDASRLDAALKRLITAKSKQEIIEVLRADGQ